MTREEVVKWLESLKRETGKAENRSLWHYAESIDMAIKALKAKTDGDLIGRSDAIDACCRGWNNTAEDCIRNIKALPSADAVKGEWIDIDSYYRMATCSHCLKVTMFEKWGEYTRPYNYCPNCGARMNGGEEE